MDYTKKYLKYKAKYIELKSKLQISNMSGGGNKPTIYLFKADWCPHCTKFIPIWEMLKKNLAHKINFVTYDSEKHAEEIKNYKISGFPTIILIVNNKAVEYEGPRDENSVNDFINQYTN